MVTRLVSLSREKGLRRVAARFDGRRAAAATAIGFVRARRPTTTVGDGGNGEAVACWCCSSCCGRILALGLSLGVRRQEIGLLLRTRVSEKGKGVRKK